MRAHSVISSSKAVFALLLCGALSAAAAPSRGLLDEQARATQSLLAQRPSFGLDGDSGFAVRHAFTNPQGRTVVHLQQTWQGLRVWGGGAIVHVEPDGSLHLLTEGVKSAVSVPSAAARVDADAALRIALRELAPRGPLSGTPAVEAVIFPTRFMGGLETRIDPKTGRSSIDFARSLFPHRPTASYVRAWEIRTVLSNAKDGHREMNYVIDAASGAILRKWSALQSASAPTYTPAVGTGQSYYRGTVALPLGLAADGSYALVSPERGSLPQPFVAAQGETQIGLTTYYGYIDFNAGLVGFLPYLEHAGTDWGNGSAFPVAFDPSLGRMILDYSADRSTAWPQHALDPIGETAAVDAQFGLATTWDFYKNIFDRDGIDGKGTSTMAIVHDITGSTPAQAFPMLDNAFWSPDYFGMVFGDGSYALDGTGMRAVTELDITGHELSHGVSAATADLIYAGQSGGLNEGNSDIFGKMVQAYADNNGAQGSHIGDFAAGDLVAWEIGHKSGPNGGLRFMYQPSLDGVSVDEWYDGVDDIDVHYSSGPVNRFFYFLAEGASSSPTSASYSRYLPGGMTGLGNERSARLWYKALTEYLPSDADFLAARAASLMATQDLFGAGSAEEAAVMRAWAAVNVGEAPGERPRVRLTFPIVHGPGSFLDTNAAPHGVLEKVRLYPIQSTVRLQVDVANTSNHGVTWDVTWPTGNSPVGVVNSDGTWTTPNFAFYADLLRVHAVSEADPTQYAIGQVLLVQGDADSDDEIDALDLGRVATSWGVTSQPWPAVSVAGNGLISDWDIVFSTESMANAWPVTF